MTSDLVERLRSANTWLNDGDCCGQRDASGTCMAPACIFGDALKMAHEAAARIEKLEAALRYALENGVCTQYWGDDDDCGTHGCCGEVSYKPHDAECWTVKARAALEGK